MHKQKQYSILGKLVDRVTFRSLTLQYIAEDIIKEYSEQQRYSRKDFSQEEINSILEMRSLVPSIVGKLRAWAKEEREIDFAAFKRQAEEESGDEGL